MNIKIKDKLPKEYQDVLVFINNQWRTGFWYSLFGYPIIWKVDGKDYWESTAKIEYWRYLPDDPNWVL